MSRLLAISLVAFASVSFTDSAQAKTSPGAVEASIVAQVKMDHDRARSLLRETVEINSGTIRPCSTHGRLRVQRPGAAFAVG